MASNYKKDFDYAEAIAGTQDAGERQQLLAERQNKIEAEGLAGNCLLYTSYIRRNRAANGMPNGQIYAAFVEEYPDVRPEEIPPQVWEWAQQEGSLVSAYRKWEILTLKDELAALEMNQKNRRAAVGAAQSDGEPAGVDPVTLALLGK